MSSELQSGGRCFPFEFAAAFRHPLRLLGIRPENARVVVGRDSVAIRFGPWHLVTTRANVIDATITGPLRWWRAIGPHLSLVDRGVTFGSSTRAGVCIRFAVPVPGLLPGGWLAHPAATVTVADAGDLAACLSRPESRQ